MGNLLNKNVIINAKQLQEFFNNYEDSSKKKELLEYIPVSRNYNIYNFGRLVDKNLNFHTSPRPLYVDVNVEYYPSGCNIKITKEYQQKLINFRNNNKPKKRFKKHMKDFL